MLFRSYKPSPPLCDFIANFWIYEGYEGAHLKERILPSGTFELVFNLRDDELRIYKAARPQECKRLSGAILSGPYSGSFLTDTAEEASVMGVHFKPGGAFPFFHFAAGELSDQHADLETIFGRAATEFHEQLSLKASPMRRFRLLEEFLMSRLHHSPARRAAQRNDAVSTALDALACSGYQTRTRALARQAQLSEKRFIDVFRFEVGLKPKIFSRIQRFQKIIAQLRQPYDADWAQLAAENGYFDQSHLIRDFVAFSGFTPGDFVRRLKHFRQTGSHVKFNHMPLAH